MKEKFDVLIDINPAVNSQKSGIGYYTHNLVAAMTVYKQTKFTLSGYYFNLLGKNKNDHELTLKYKEIRFMPGKIISLFKIFGLRPYLDIFVRSKSDITLFTNYVSLPRLQNNKNALIVYDLAFLDTPEYLKDNNLAYLQKYSTKSIQEADLIITISEFTKSRIESHFPSTKDKIIITPIPPLQRAISKTDISDELHNLGIEDRRYILFVGTLEPRKNIANLVRAYEQLPEDVQKTYSLVLAGGSGWKDEEIKEAIASAKNNGLKIIQTGYVSEEDRDALYANAALFVFPSHYEGFGMPLLEAMQYNIPIAVSDISVFHEVAGESVVYFNKDNPENIAENIVNYLNDDAKKQKLIATYSECLNKYSWENNAKIVFNAFEKLVK